MKYFTKEIWNEEGYQRTAGIKARDDVDAILEQNGFEGISICAPDADREHQNIFEKAGYHIKLSKVWDDCLTAEIEYCIGKRFWGRGYAGEALSALVRYAFENTDFVKLEAYHRAENTKSGRVLEKSSMHKTDTVQRFVHEGVVPAGEVCYCITKNDYNLL
jgi:RimJ/RimL family protein N-acetyltransferase